jgi:hypothetical protein
MIARQARFFPRSSLEQIVCPVFERHADRYNERPPLVGNLAVQKGTVNREQHDDRNNPSHPRMPSDDRAGRHTAGASSFDLLRDLFADAPRQIVIVDYAPRLVVDYYATGIFPAATGRAVTGNV